MNENEIRANLYIDDEGYNIYWEEWKEKIFKALNKHKTILKKENVAYCLESDLQVEKEFLEECGKKLKVIVNENGLVIYKITNKE